MALWFIETPIFSSDLQELLPDEDYRALQLALALRPEQGPLIPGGGGLRKLRWALPGRGKRGGLRVIYFWEPSEDLIYLLFLFAKNEQEDLTAAQLKMLRQIIEKELK